MESQSIIACNKSLRSVKQIHGLAPSPSPSSGGNRLPQHSIARSIITINLHMNELATLDGLAACVNLTSLDVSANHLTAMESVLLSFPKLVELNLSGNAIRAIEHVGRLARLERLSLAFNSLTSLKGLAQLPPASCNGTSHHIASSQRQLAHGKGPSSLLPPLLKYLDVRCNDLGLLELSRGMRYGQRVNRSRSNSAARAPLAAADAGLMLEGKPFGLASEPLTQENNDVEQSAAGASSPSPRTQSPVTGLANEATSLQLLHPLSRLANLQELLVTYVAGDESKKLRPDAGANAHRASPKQNPFVGALADPDSLEAVLAQVAPQLSLIDGRASGVSIVVSSATDRSSIVNVSDPSLLSQEDIRSPYIEGPAGSSISLTATDGSFLSSSDLRRLIDDRLAALEQAYDQHKAASSENAASQPTPQQVSEVLRADQQPADARTLALTPRKSNSVRLPTVAENRRARTANLHRTVHSPSKVLPHNSSTPSSTEISGNSLISDGNHMTSHMTEVATQATETVEQGCQTSDNTVVTAIEAPMANKVSLRTVGETPTQTREPPPDAVFAKLLAKEASALRNEIALRDNHWAIEVDRMRTEERRQREAVLRVTHQEWADELQARERAITSEFEARMSAQREATEKNREEAITVAVAYEKDRARQHLSEVKAKRRADIALLQSEVAKLLAQSASQGNQFQLLSAKHAEDLSQALDRQKASLAALHDEHLILALRRQESQLVVQMGDEIESRMAAEVQQWTSHHAEQIKGLEKLHEIRELEWKKAAEAQKQQATRYTMGLCDLQTECMTTKIHFAIEATSSLMANCFREVAGHRKNMASLRVGVDAASQTSVCCSISCSSNEFAEFIPKRHLDGLTGRNEELELLVLVKDKELSRMREELVDSLQRSVSSAHPAVTAASSNLAAQVESLLQANAQMTEEVAQYQRTVDNLKSSLGLKDQQLVEIEEEARAKIEQKREQIRSLEDLLEAQRGRAGALEIQLERERADKESKMLERQAATKEELEAQFAESYSKKLGIEVEKLDGDVRSHYEGQLQTSLAQIKGNLALEMQSHLDEHKATFAASLKSKFSDEKQQLLSVIDALRSQLAEVHEAHEAHGQESSYLKHELLPELRNHLAALQSEVNAFQSAEAASKERTVRQERFLRGALQELSVNHR